MLVSQINEASSEISNASERTNQSCRLAIADGAQFRVVDWGLAVFGADDDQGGIVVALTPQFRDDSSESFVDEIEFGGEARCRFAKNVQIAAVYRWPVLYEWTAQQFLSNTDGLEIESEECRDWNGLRAIVRVAIDLVHDGCHVKQVVALDIAEVGRPAVVEGIVDERYWIAARELRKPYRIRVDFRSVKVIDTFAAGAIGPFVGGVLVGPGRAAAIAFHDFENRVHLEVFMREDREALVDRRAARNLD